MKRTLATVVALLAMLIASPARAATTHWVDDDELTPVPPGTSCSDAGYTTIGAAVTAAAPGDTIRVCPGTYTAGATVPATKSPLTLRGDNSTRKDCFDASFPALDPTKDTIVDPVASLTGTGFLVFADDFTLRDFVITDFDKGTRTDPLTSGHDLRGNTYLMNREGINLLTDGTSPTQVKDNCFRENSAGQTGGDSIVAGEGIKDVWITHNRFFATEQGGTVADISLFEEPGAVEDVRIEHNESRASDTFAALTNAQRSSIAHNKVISNGLGSGIFVGSENAGGPNLSTFDVDVSHNKIEGAVRGIRFFDVPPAGGATATMVTVAHNKVEGSTGAGPLDGGIIANPDSLDASFFEHNKVNGGAGPGLYLQSGNTGNTLEHNNAKGNTGVDCVDETVGGGTAGTANTWTKNKGDDDIPDGICKP